LKGGKVGWSKRIDVGHTGQKGRKNRGNRPSTGKRGVAYFGEKEKVPGVGGFFSLLMVTNIFASRTGVVKKKTVSEHGT